jgi:tRNA(Arg) A34 adenosine deaminase TadA
MPAFDEFEQLEAHGMHLVTTWAGHSRPTRLLDYFLELVPRALAARARGDYGIAAVVVLRWGTFEFAAFGENRMFSACDPQAHAEMQAIELVRDFVSNPTEGDVILRQQLDAVTSAESLLLSSVEPCPMCTTAILNSGIESVAFAVPDEQGGAIGPEHIVRIAPAFQGIAAKRPNLVRGISDVAGDRFFVPPELVAFFQDLFLFQREELDRRIEETGVLNLPDVREAATMLSTT